jgi:hypothetical protein
MWQLFQEFLKNPADLDGITQRLEERAERAWGSSPPAPPQRSAAAAKQKSTPRPR